MADFCDILKSPKYLRTKLCVSTGDYQSLDILSNYYMEVFNELPELDELSFVNSINLLKEGLNLKDDNYTTEANILNYTNSSSIDEALLKLNNELHSDLIIDIIPITLNVLSINYNRRPHKTSGLNTNFDKFTETPTEHKKLIFLDMLYDISKKLGVLFKYVTNEDLSSEQWVNILGDTKLSNAFIYDGDVYINTDNSTIDSMLHELTHILLGNVRYINPQLYVTLLEQVETIPNISKLFPLYLNRTHTDILEEILVTEFSKYITGSQSIFDNLSKNQIHKIDYYMYRCLDTMLNGEHSTSAVFKNSLGNTTLYELGKKVNSSKLENVRSGRGDYSYIHRVVNNEKTKLIKSKDLIEEC